MKKFVTNRLNIIGQVDLLTIGTIEAPKSKSAPEKQKQKLLSNLKR